MCLLHVLKELTHFHYNTAPPSPSTKTSDPRVMVFLILVEVSLLNRTTGPCSDFSLTLKIEMLILTINNTLPIKNISTKIVSNS